MELEEMKQKWMEYDQKLDRNLKLNEELLRKRHLDRSRQEMRTPVNYELFNIPTGVLFIIWIAGSTFQHAGDFRLLLSGLISLLSMVPVLIFSIMRLNAMSKIDYYNTSVVDLQKQISLVKKKYLLTRKLEMYWFPIFVISVIPILAMAMRHLDIFEHPYRYLTAIALALALGYPCMIWVYNNWYGKKLKNTSAFLEELRRFEAE